MTSTFDRWLDWCYWGPDHADPQPSGDRVPRRPAPTVGAGSVALEPDND